MMADEIVSTSPVFVYKTNDVCPVTGVQLFIAFHVNDILSLDQRFGQDVREMDSITPIEMVCLTLKSDPARHIHLTVGFHEIMLRWMNWMETNG